jgi:hypothetical protein
MPWPAVHGRRLDERLTQQAHERRHLDEGRVRFVQRERFKGLLLPLLSKMLDGETRRGFEEMNRPLKLRVVSAA